MNRFLSVAAGITLALPGAVAATFAAEKQEPEAKPKWSNSTELSIVVTEGNSDAETIGFKDTLTRRWKRADLQFKVDALRSDTADDRFVRVDPGLEWQPGEVPVVTSTSIVSPPIEPDVERYFAQGIYSRKLPRRQALTWNAGGSWERNEDAGILNRYIIFSGIGHEWWNRDDLEFSTAYNFSWTRREEETFDPLKEERFVGLRLTWDYTNHFGKVTIYENDFVGNLNLQDTGDYTLGMTNSIGANLGKHLALKVSLQWFYESEPALEEVDLIAFVDLIDPDGVPGSGDEFFRTVEFGNEIELGDTDIRKEQLDTIFRTSLVINF